MERPAGGFLVVIEGIDGAGKSGICKSLAAYCAAEGIAHVTSREPTDSQYGRKLRESGATGRLSLQEELHLFLLDRREHVTRLITPYMDEGIVVILDRYYLSTAAYQGARGADSEAILRENELFAPEPDLALLLDVPPAAGLSRVRIRGDIPNEFERESALGDARAIFLGITRPWIVRIDASGEKAEVLQRCIDAFRRAFDRKKATRPANPN